MSVKLEVIRYNNGIITVQYMVTTINDAHEHITNSKKVDSIVNINTCGDPLPISLNYACGKAKFFVTKMLTTARILLIPLILGKKYNYDITWLIAYKLYITIAW